MYMYVLKKLKCPIYTVLVLACIISVSVNFFIFFNPTKFSRFAVLTVRPNSTAVTELNFWIGMTSYCMNISGSTSCSGFSFHPHYDISAFPKEVSARPLKFATPTFFMTSATLTSIILATISWFFTLLALYLEVPKNMGKSNVKRRIAEFAGLCVVVAFGFGIGNFFKYYFKLKKVVSSLKGIPNPPVAKLHYDGVVVCWSVFLVSSAITLLLVWFTSEPQSVTIAEYLRQEGHSPILFS